MFNELDKIDKLVEYVNNRFRLNMKEEMIEDRTVAFVVDLFVKELINIANYLESKLGDRF